MSGEDFVNMEVDGVPVRARKGEMIIRVTDANHAYVPRFCYHDKLTIAANCRMCLVEVEKAPKPLPACATPVAEGMKVFTKSPRAIGAQRATMEFLLINHPLDCPICDQGGECELQDLAMGFGRDLSRYEERKRAVPDENLGPLIATDMTRCIHCTRCVRFTQEIAGYQELGMIGRGEQMKVRTYVEQTVHHEMSGNVIDLCPVGALVSKPYRFSARAWEMISHPLVSPHDGVGSNLYGHVLRGRLMRVIPRENESINETWISDRDRFGYEGIYSADRLLKPMLREIPADGASTAAEVPGASARTGAPTASGPAAIDEPSWVEVDWESALTRTAEALRGYGADLGVLASSGSTLEELYLLSRLSRALGTSNIDHRLRQQDFRDQEADPLFPSLGMRIAEVDALNGLLVIGSSLRRELPVLAHRVRKAALRGAKVAFVSPVPADYLFPVAANLVSASAAQVAELAAIVAAVSQARGRGVSEHLSAVVGQAAVEDRHRAAAAVLAAGERQGIWLGALALRHPAYADLRALAAELAALTGSILGVLPEGGNAAGAYIAGAVPHRDAAGRTVVSAGLTARQMLERPRKAYLLFGGVEPWNDGLDIDSRAALSSAELVVAITPFAGDRLRELAHVMLPIGTFAETSGTYVNLEGLWQSQSGAAAPVGESRPGWKVLRVLANLCGVPDSEYQSSEEVRDELRTACAQLPAPPTYPTYSGHHRVELTSGRAEVLDLSMYQTDAVVRRAPSLQKTQEGRRLAVPY